jgi:hypothetical protein
MEDQADSTPLMESSEDYNYVLHFNNPYSTSKHNKSLTLDQAKLILSQSFKLTSSSSKGTSESIHNFLQSRLSEFRLSSSSDSLPLTDLQIFIIETTLSLLQDYLKIFVDLSYSQDSSDIYLKLSTSELNFKLQAHLSDYPLQLRDIQNSPSGVVSPYLPYSSQPGDSASYEHSFKHFDQYDNEVSPFELQNEKVSLFASRDKIKLIHDMINNVMDLDYMTHAQVLQNHFPPHNLQQVEKLRKNWAVNVRIWNFDSIADVRNYFGEEVALLYSCGKYYSVWMIIVAVVGIAIFIAGFIDEMKDGSRNYSCLSLAYAVFIVASACMVDIKWFRFEQRIRYAWGVTEDHPNTQQLPTYPGEYQEDQLTGKIKRFPTSSRFNYYKLLGISLTILFTCLTLFLNYFLFLSETASSLFSDHTKHILLAMQMQILRVIHTRLTLRICYHEGVETYKQYEERVISRTSIFNYISTMAPLAYILLFKESFQLCTDNNCISEMSALLLKVFLIKYKIYLFEKLIQ